MVLLRRAGAESTLVITIENTSNEGNPNHSDHITYMGDDFIYALYDRVYSIPKEYMDEIKNRSLQTNKLSYPTLCMSIGGFFCIDLRHDQPCYFHAQP